MKIRILIGIIAIVLLAGCQQMEPTQYGVRFRKLPPLIGGGVSDNIIRPGEFALVMPWESIYTFDTKTRDVSWGSSRSGKEGRDFDFVYTRARDGNELALAFTVRYRISPEPARLVHLLEHGATNDEQVRDLVVTVGRSEIRRSMNELHTGEFLDTRSRYAAVDAIKQSMEQILGPLGIDIVQVNLDDYRFERKLKDDSVDTSYQQRLAEIQRLVEDTEKERSRIETVKARKEQDRQAMEAQRARWEAEADGYRNQAKLRADAYFESRSNESKAILARGKSEAQGLLEKLAAISGTGGAALLRLEIAKALKEGDAKFIIMDQGKSSLGVSRTDNNQLLDQMGLMEAMKEKDEKKQQVVADPQK